MSNEAMSAKERVLALYQGHAYDVVPLLPIVAAIEAEAVAAERARITAAVDQLDKYEIDRLRGITFVRLSKVLAIVEWALCWSDLDAGVSWRKRQPLDRLSEWEAAK